MDEMGAPTDQRLPATMDFSSAGCFYSSQTLFGKDSTAPQNPSTNLHMETPRNTLR